MNNTSRKQSGFTIVELLIVIVVIGILAAITIVAYNGIQKRALNTSRISSARQALQVVRSYQAIHGTYPSIPAGVVEGTQGACLGTGWPIVDGQAVCWNIYKDGAGPGPSTFFEDDVVNTALKEIGTLPDYPKDIATTATDMNGRVADLSALALVHRTTTGSSIFKQGYSLAYLLAGDVDCGVGGAERTLLHDATRCVIYLNS